MIVSLLTDFGLADTYVGQLKAAILAVAPDAALVDLTHAVPAQDIQTGAFLLATAVEAFPAGSVHLAVVDPGVGSTRQPVAARAARGDHLVGPDNGLLIPALEALGGCTRAVTLDQPAFWGPRRSSTFHGRDLFGPVAGHLARGVPLEQMGTPTTLATPFALPTADGLHGQVVYVDTYGNLITNIPADALPTRFVARIGGYEATQAHAYADVPAGTLMALVSSAHTLEIAARDASAAALTHARRGDAVRVDPR